MKILFDHQAFIMQRFGGVSKSFCKLITNFPKNIEYEISVKQSNNIHLIESNIVPNIKKVILDFYTFRNFFKFRGMYVMYRILNKIPFIRTSERVNLKNSIEYLKKNDFDVFHPTFFDTYFLKYLNHKPFVITVHDMMPEIFPEYFKYPNPETIQKKILCEKASAIVAVSNKTKEDLINIFGIKEDKISVVYHGGPDIVVSNEKPIIKQNYFLFVGQRTAYKNFEQTILDFKVFHDSYSDVLLVCTGSLFTNKEKALIRKCNLENVIVQRFSSESQMINLYSNAIAFIYPSLYEGFGMPILEAFAYGCIALLNNKSCFPEIGGNACLYFESDNKVSNLPSLMKKVYNMNSNEKNFYVHKGYLRLQDFSWEKSSEQLGELYRSVLDKFKN